MAEPGKGSGCGDSCAGVCGPREVPSAEEKEALDALRSIKMRVRELKALQGAGTHEASGNVARGNNDLRQELERLRKEWKLWEGKRAEAARKRMILLGHEDPG